MSLGLVARLISVVVRQMSHAPERRRVLCCSLGSSGRVIVHIHSLKINGAVVFAVVPVG
jgi:hypothetical protein